MKKLVRCTTRRFHTDVQKWIANVRDRYCSPLSFDSKRKSTYSVVLATDHVISLYNFEPRFFNHSVIVSPRYSVLISNKNVEIFHDNFVTWFEQNYHNVRYNGALVCMESIGNAEETKQIVNRTLSNSHTPCPMVIVKTITEFDVASVNSRVTMSMNDGAHYYYAFIGHKNLEDAQQQIQRQSRHGLPIVQDLNQFEIAWTMPFVKNRVTQILKYIFQVSSIQEQHQRVILNEIDDYIIHKKSDKDIYELVYQLREKYKKPVSMMAERANGRALEIASLLPESFHVKSFLDVGCAEGSIPITLRKVLNVGVRDAHGCDVRDIVGNHDFSFRKISNDGKLPYNDNSISLVMSLMAMHHIHNPVSAIKEIYRVLEPGGYLLIREHDCDPTELALVLDIVHGLYSQVIRDDLDPHDPSFTDTYFAKYLSASEVVELVTTTSSFVQAPIVQQPQPWTHHAVGNAIEKNPLQTYYVMFQKV